MSYKFHNSILRAYDIRGIIDETLSNEDAFFIGKSFATHLKKEGKNKVVIGYDGRLSSVELKDSLAKGLVESGCEVVNIGLGPTPMLYFGVHFLEFDAGIMITGSHNPANHNGFKLTLKDSPFFGEQILELGKISQEGNFIEGSGSLKNKNILENYVNRVIQDSALSKEGALIDEIDDFFPEERILRIAWDAGNGAAGEVMKKISKRLKTKNFLLFDKIDGSFPNHHPDPTMEENLIDLKNCVFKNNCHLGIAFDGDGDRIGVIDDEGVVIWGDQLMSIFAKSILKEQHGATIIADVKASQTLFDAIKENGGKPLMWKTGHSFIKSKMKEINAPLAGEMSGHIFFADKYYGFDDALYAAIRLIDILLSSDKKLSDIRKKLPKTYATAEIRIECDDIKKFSIISDIQAELRKNNQEFNDIDGVRLNNKDGWWLLRASNTQAVLVARCEGKTPEQLENLKENLANILTKNNVTLPEILENKTDFKQVTG